MSLTGLVQVGAFHRNKWTPVEAGPQRGQLTCVFLCETRFTQLSWIPARLRCKGALASSCTDPA